MKTLKKKIDESTIREKAYLNWLAETGGTPVSQEETDRFWVKAEQELIKPQEPSSKQE